MMNTYEWERTFCTTQFNSDRGNGWTALREYSFLFPSRRVPNHQILSAVFNTIAQCERVPDIKNSLQSDLERDKEVLDLVQTQPSIGIRRIPAQFSFFWYFSKVIFNVHTTFYYTPYELMKFFSVEKFIMK